MTDPSGDRVLTADELMAYNEGRKYMAFIRNKIDSDIGYNYWKNYIVSAFWSNIATPLNLTITFLTAITAAQAQNINLLPENVNSNVAIINLVITTLITFFRPHEQYSIYSDYVKRWVELGVDLEKEFSTKAAASGNTHVKLSHVEKQRAKIERYTSIQDRCVDLRKAENNSVINSATDLVFVLVYYFCMCRLCRGPKRWLDYDRRIHAETESEFKGTCEQETQYDLESGTQPDPLPTISLVVEGERPHLKLPAA